jgi:hypothetical protein
MFFQVDQRIKRLVLDFYDFKNINAVTHEQNCFLTYVGYMSEDVLESFGKNLRKRMKNLTMRPGQNRHVFSLFVEMMQNIIRYGDEGQPLPMVEGCNAGYGMLAVSREDDNICIMGGNYISPERAKDISQRLDALAVSTQDELRQIFMKALRQPKDPDSKGAGLGLIEMMRRSSTPPQYHMDHAQDGSVFFMIKATA